MFFKLAKSMGNDASEKLSAIQKKLVDEAWLSDAAAADSVCRIFMTAVGTEKTAKCREVREQTEYINV